MWVCFIIALEVTDVVFVSHWPTISIQAGSAPLYSAPNGQNGTTEVRSHRVFHRFPNFWCRKLCQTRGWKNQGSSWVKSTEEFPRRRLQVEFHWKISSVPSTLPGNRQETQDLRAGLWRFTFSLPLGNPLETASARMPCKRWGEKPFVKILAGSVMWRCHSLMRFCFDVYHFITDKLRKIGNISCNISYRDIIQCRGIPVEVSLTCHGFAWSRWCTEISWNTRLVCPKQFGFGSKLGYPQNGVLGTSWFSWQFFGKCSRDG